MPHARQPGGSVLGHGSATAQGAASANADADVEVIVDHLETQSARHEGQAPRATAEKRGRKAGGGVRAGGGGKSRSRQGRDTDTPGDAAELVLASESTRGGRAIEVDKEEVQEVRTILSEEPKIKRARKRGGEAAMLAAATAEATRAATSSSAIGKRAERGKAVPPATRGGRKRKQTSEELEEEQDIMRAVAASLQEDGVRAAGAAMRTGASSRSRKKVAEVEADECDEQMQKAIHRSIASNQDERSQAVRRPDEGDAYTDEAQDGDLTL